MDQKEFGLYFAKLREKSGFESQRQLAIASGVSNGTIARIEAGTQEAKPPTLKKLAPYLKNVDYEDLMRAAGYLDENGQPSSEEDELDQQVKEMMNDPETGVFFKDYLSAPEEKKKQLREFMKFLLQEEKDRIPGDKQGE
jgi:transcriptional regulator with XRE-family HTH domain